MLLLLQIFFCNERDFLLSLSNNNQADNDVAFNSTSRYQDNLLNIDNPYFEEMMAKVRKRARIRNRYNQAPHLTQDTNGKSATSQLDISSESREVSPFPAGDHKASTNSRA